MQEKKQLQDPSFDLRGTLELNGSTRRRPRYQHGLLARLFLIGSHRLGCYTEGGISMQGEVVGLNYYWKSKEARRNYAIGAKALVVIETAGAFYVWLLGRKILMMGCIRLSSSMHYRSISVIR